MSFSYSGDPSKSPVDAARFLLGDTNSDEPILYDEEIKYLIDTYGEGTSKFKYELFSHAATQFARDIKRSLGPQSEDPSGRLEYFKSQAEYYKNIVVAGGVSPQKYSYPKIFSKGMHSNPPWPKAKR